jgi:hypothetical protein
MRPGRSARRNHGNRYPGDTRNALVPGIGESFARTRALAIRSSPHARSALFELAGDFEVEVGVLHVHDEASVPLSPTNRSTRPRAGRANSSPDTARPSISPGCACASAGRRALRARRTRDARGLIALGWAQDLSSGWSRGTRAKPDSGAADPAEPHPVQHHLLLPTSLDRHDSHVPTPCSRMRSEGAGNNVRAEAERHIADHALGEAARIGRLSRPAD